jgi:hypothetical protein
MITSARLNRRTYSTSSHRRRWLLPFLVIAAILAQDTNAEQTRRALIIGINDYSSGGNGSGGRGKWTDLDGAVNDVEGLKAILISKYGFPPANIKTLINKEATRKNILDAYHSVLIDPVKKGDVCLFYYAGHGSQVINSKTDEPDGKDETIVPADSNKGEWDIRDKEIARLFNDTLDKEGRLTVLFDSCHSGSIARGQRIGKARSLESDSRDIATVIKDEKPDPRGRPEARKNGALIMSAAQDHQLAYEAIDGEGLPHGSFSLALQRALQAGPTQSSIALYKRARGLMQANGIKQDPVMAGPTERFSQPLFGGSPDDAFGGTVVTVLRSSSKKAITLDGGRAVGLHAGCELVKVGDEAVRLEVTALKGLSKATAEIKKGRSSSVRNGDLFKLDKWAAPDEAHLQAWVPAALDFASIVGMAKSMAPVGADASIDWVDEPTKQKPTHEMRWTGKEWVLDADGGRSAKLGKSPSAADVIAAVKKSGGKARFFLNLPPTADLREAIGLDSVDPKAAIVSAKTIERAQYVLFGRINDGLPEYAWVQPAATTGESKTSTLPARGDWLEMAEDRESARDIGVTLWGHAKSLGRIRAWITLDGPPQSSSFPYDLRVKRLSNGELLDGGDITEADTYQLVLVHRNPTSTRPPQKRFAYVFVLDSYGNSTLLFPPLGQGNVENTVPYKISRNPEKQFPLGDVFQIGPPYGLDTYVLLTSKEPIDSPDTVLDAQGVRTRGAAETSGLGSLLTGIGGATRGARRATPTSWSIERLSFVSKP